jgi:hypothetical protein
MEDNFVCECGSENFWYFWGYVRCSKCFNEYRLQFRTNIIFNHSGYPEDPSPHFEMRRFDKEKNQYHDNWESAMKLRINNKNKK